MNVFDSPPIKSFFDKAGANTVERERQEEFIKVSLEAIL